MGLWLKRIILFPILSLGIGVLLLIMLGFFIGLFFGDIDIEIPDSIFWLAVCTGFALGIIATLMLTHTPVKKEGVVNG